MHSYDDDVRRTLETLRFTTLSACRRLRASLRRAMLFHCLRALDHAIPLVHDDPRLYRSLHGCRRAIEDALNAKPRSRLDFTRSVRDQILEACRKFDLWKREPDAE